MECNGKKVKLSFYEDTDLELKKITTTLAFKQLEMEIIANAIH